MKFVDRVRVRVEAGNGGDGMVAWRREKFVPRGGPAGGDGGQGGDIVLVADRGLSTLLDLRYRSLIRAPHGQSGGSRDRNGKAGEDVVWRVPIGTMIYREPEPEDADGESTDAEAPADDGGGMENVYVTEAPEGTDGDGDEGDGGAGENDDDEGDGDPLASGGEAFDDAPAPFMPGAAPGLELIGDLGAHGETLVVARGGRGGRGNIHFRSSTNRAPDWAEPGRPGEQAWLRLELKLLADVGIVGFPNVGKSTLISRISRARPKIADYPFTTLVPQLGVVSVGESRSMVVADIPGLVEGAAEGRGLGHEFLRHVERTRVLLHILAPDPTPGRDPVDDLDAIEAELDAYGEMFRGRPRVVALNKVDTLSDAQGRQKGREIRDALAERNIPLFPICAHTGQGVQPLLEALWRRLERVREGSETSP